MSANFNRIAPVYDQIASIVYGSNLIEAKEAFLDLIPENASILLMGGGTGGILNDLLERKPSVMIDYVEPSEKMIAIAQKKLQEKFRSRVNFICGDEHQIPSEKTYDVSTSFFVLDCFTQNHAISFSKKITSVLREDGIWLFADFFSTDKSFHRLLIGFMYRFFKIVSNIETQVLPDYERIFEESSFEINSEKIFMNGLVKSLVLKRS